ncbi:hypothetical protein LQ327_32460 [Actinomycetospora endophytica]|uniref:Uncharacterized protein n=1 Tax=Actinomycetospora endophytica TaxID=2291215 RepID=A0ABS8PIW0_9PSEU|nr:hypothetical protein [Actinomycetospora endophytica]MCD2198094.1 hypothetical protein [Actinomycetospora endophytica]
MRALGAVPPRVAVHVVLAALPLLSITAHVAGLVPMHVSAGAVVIPTALVLLVLGIFMPMPEDRLVIEGLRWGILATAVYDVFRLDTVAFLGWWGDFIPTMGTWLIDVDPSQRVLGGVAGYVWRYAGDGGGLGVVFIVAAAATGLRRLGPTVTMAAAVLFAVGPTWGGLMVTVLLPRGQQLMFPLTPVTVGLSLAGHVIFGIVLGLGCLRCRDLEGHWSGPRVVDLEKLARWGELPDPVPVPAFADIPAALLPSPSRRALAGGSPAALAPRRPAPRLPAGGLVSGTFRSPTTARETGRPWLRPVVPAARTDSGAFEVTVVDATVVVGMAPVPAVARDARLPWGAHPPPAPGRSLEPADFGLRSAPRR